MDSRRTLAALFGAVTLALAAAPSASADFAWLTPATDVSNNTASNFSNPKVGVGPNGHVTVTFAQGTNLWSVSRAPAGSFGSPQSITTNAMAFIRSSVAVDAAGNAYAVWTEPLMPSGSAVKASVRPPGGVWGMADTLDSTNSPDEPAIAVTPAGNAVAVWRRNGGVDGLRMARRPAGGSWGTSFPLFTSGTIASQGTIDVNAGGDAVVGFRRRIGAGFFFTQAVFQPASSSVAATSIFNPGAGGGDDDEFPSVGVDNAGNAAALFGRLGTVKVSNKPAGSATWSSVAGTNGNVDTSSAANPRMAWNDSGQQAAVWQRSSGATIQATTRGDLGAFAPPTAIGPAAMGVNYFGPEVAIDPAGVAIAVFGATGSKLKSARSSGASWNGVNDVATAGNPNGQQIATDDQGNAAVAFSATNASVTTSAMAAGFDGAGPRLDDIVFPANAVAGQSFSYSVTPLDVWSAVASTGWSFGEGSSATGASGSFTYPAAGNFAATVTSTDSRGNQSSAVRNVAVSSGPGGGGGDTTAPVFQSARLTNTTFRVNRRGAAEQPSSSAKRGTTFVYSLSEAARVVFTIQRALPGRRVGGRCRKPTRRNRTRPRCTRFVRFGSFAHDSSAGRNRKRFSGKIGRRSLRPGRYRAVLVARDAAGNRSGPRPLRFRVVRR